MFNATKVSMLRFPRRLGSDAFTLENHYPRRQLACNIHDRSGHSSAFAQSHTGPDLQFKHRFGRAYCCCQSYFPLFHQRQARYSSSNDRCYYSANSNTLPATSGNMIDDKSETTIAIPGSQTGGKKLAIVFTCTVCDTRSAKQFTENAYLKGVVIVTCPGCQNKHLIADNLGFFEDREDGGWNIQKAMEKIGQDVKLVTNDNVMELNVDDQLVHNEPTQESLDDVTPKNPTASDDAALRRSSTNKGSATRTVL
jgi:mitochondrial protein import protein ZIM17